MSGWHLALKELRRNLFRSLLVLTAVVIATAVVTGVILLLAGVEQAVGQTVGRLGADIMVVPAGQTVEVEFNELLLTGKPASFYLPRERAERIARMEGVAAVSSQTFLESLSNASCCAGKFFLVGLDPKTDFTVTPWLQDGRREDLPQGGDWVLVGDRILLRKGQSVRLYGKTFTVAGVLEHTGMGMDWSVYLSDQGLREMVAGSAAHAERRLSLSQGQVSAIFVKAGPGVDPTDLAERIEQEQDGVQAILTSSVAGKARQRMAGMSTLLSVATAVLWAMALVVCGLLFSQAVKQRQSEIGLLMAKGARRRFVLGLLSREALALSLPGAVIGSVAAVGVLWVLRQPLAELFAAEAAMPAAPAVLRLAGLMTVLLAASATLASLLPAAWILRLEPIQAITRARAA